MKLSDQQEKAITLAIGVLSGLATAATSGPHPAYVEAIEALRSIVEGDGKVWPLTFGSGDYGDEWGVKSIHATRERAEEVKAHHNKTRPKWDTVDIEEWELT